MATLEERILGRYDVDDTPDDPAEQIRRRIYGGYGLNPARTPKYPALPAAESASLQDNLLNAGGSVLGMIGGTIDKLGFRQIRALASGHLEDIPRSLIPFGGSLGIDDQSHNLSWDDILTGKGRVLPQLISENDPEHWELRDLAGPALDIFAGPKIPVPFALTKYGQAARKANVLPRTLAQQVGGFVDDAAGLAARGPSSPLPFHRAGGLLERPAGVLGNQVMGNLEKLPRTIEEYAAHPINQPVAPPIFAQKVAEAGLPPYTPGTPLRSAVELGFPGLGSVQLGGGDRTRRVAEMLSRASDAIQYGRDLAPGVRNPVPLVRNLFDAATGNALDPQVQYSNVTAGVPARNRILRESLYNEGELRRGIEESVRAGGLVAHEPHVMQFLRDRAEGLPIANSPLQWASERGLAPAAVPGFAAEAPRLQAIGDRMAQSMRQIADQSQQYGLPFAELKDQYINYLSRRVPASGTQSAAQSIAQRLWNQFSGRNIRRISSLRDNPGGTSAINAASTDPRFSGPAATLSPRQARRTMLREQMPDLLRGYRENVSNADVLNHIFPRFSYNQLRGVAAGVRPGLVPAIEGREAAAILARHPALAATPGLSLPALRTALDAAHPGALAGIQMPLQHRLRLALGRAMEVGDESVVRGLIDPTQLRTDFLKRSAEGQAARIQVRRFTRFLRQLDPIHAAEGRPLFAIDPAADVTRSHDQFGRALAGNRGAVDLVRRLATPAVPNDPTQMPLYDFLKQMNPKLAETVPRPLDAVQSAAVQAAGFGSADEVRSLVQEAAAGNPLAVRRLAAVPQDVQDFAALRSHSGLTAEALRNLRHQGLGGFSPEDIINQAPGAPAAKDILSGFALPRTPAAEALANQTRFLTPHPIEPFQNAWDSMQSLYKAALYPIWPASQVRNYIGGMYNNWQTGSFDPRYGRLNPRRYVQPQVDMANLLRGGNIEPLPMFAHLPPAEAKFRTIQTLYGDRIAFQSGLYNEAGDLGDIANVGTLRRLIDPTAAPVSIPGAISQNVRGTVAEIADAMRRTPAAGNRDAINPLAIRGWFGRTEDTNALVRASRQVGSVSEDMLRGGQGLALLRQGYAPAAVGDIVRGTHFDYRDLADFEKSVLRRIMPFYTFTRKNLPFQVKQLLTAPERPAKTIQAFQAARGNTFVPAYLGGGFAVPLGQEEDGTQRFLSQTGLPLEEAFEKLKLNYNHGIPLPDVKRTAMDYAGLLNPMIKGPLEQFTDTQFFTGRRLSDLKPTGVGTLGGYLEGDNAQLLSQLIANTPLSRFASTLDRVIDTRKTGIPGTAAKLFNLGTGFKVSDIDMEASRNREVRNMLEEAMRRDPAISTFLEAYIPPDKLEDATQNRPDTIRLMRMFSQMKLDAKRKAEERRKLQQVQGVR